jgi:hypothetical protein
MSLHDYRFGQRLRVVCSEVSPILGRGCITHAAMFCEAVEKLPSEYLRQLPFTPDRLA